MTTRPLPSLNALRAFEATARHLSMQRAAHELSVTPTAVSHQVRLLEADVGAPLFTRAPRQLALTPRGQALLDGLTPAFDALAQAVARARQPEARAAVIVSATPAVAARWLLPRVPALRADAPRLDLRLHISHDYTPLDGVAADAAIRYGSGQWPGLCAHKLFDNDFVPACSPALGLRTRRQLPRHTLLHFEPTGVRGRAKGWPHWQRLAAVPGLDTRAGPVFSDETHAIAAALAGQGVGLMSRFLIQDELARGTLVQPFGPVLPGQPFYLVYPEARQHDEPIATLRRWLLA
ncbi:MAG: LysR substrate-binding domain-containing protein [Pseudomonadota bacterium]|nr:LysR substrate-binding domain-containing protein [Pseudomonadota bacterium]